MYRHWRSPGALLVDAMAQLTEPFPPPATGSLRNDLIALVSALEALLGDRPFPRLLAAFVDAAERDPTLAGLHVRITESRRAPALQVLDEARRRGEVSPAADLELAVDLLTGPAFYRRFIAHRPFPEGCAGAIVDRVLAAIGHTLAAGDNRGMDDAVREYVDAIPPEHRPLFDRLHRLVMEVRPDARVVLSYQMPTYRVGRRRLFVGAWKHGVSIYGWGQGHDAGFTARHPELKTGSGTIQLRPEAAAAIPDDELRDLVRAALGG